MGGKPLWTRRRLTFTVDTGDVEMRKNRREQRRLRLDLILFTGEKDPATYPRGNHEREYSSFRDRSRRSNPDADIEAISLGSIDGERRINAGSSSAHWVTVVHGARRSFDTHCLASSSLKYRSSSIDSPKNAGGGITVTASSVQRIKIEQELNGAWNGKEDPESRVARKLLRAGKVRGKFSSFSLLLCACLPSCQPLCHELFDPARSNRSIDASRCPKNSSNAGGRATEELFLWLQGIRYLRRPLASEEPRARGRRKCAPGCWGSSSLFPSRCGLTWWSRTWRTLSWTL